MRIIVMHANYLLLFATTKNNCTTKLKLNLAIAFSFILSQNIKKNSFFPYFWQISMYPVPIFVYNKQPTVL